MKLLMMAFGLAAAAVESGCADGGPTVCPPYPGIGLVLTVVNDETGGLICDAVVTAQARDGSTWTMSANGSRCSYGGSGTGTYSVSAARAGFRSASLVVQVASTGGECPIAVETPATLRLVALP